MNSTYFTPQQLELLQDNIKTKIEKIATEVYGAIGVEFSEEAKKEIERIEKMGFSKLDFDTKIEEMSEGQKKKILIAKSISEQANIYIWDEPLNYIDILTREQIEDSILKYNPTLIFVEHDTTFVEKVATKIITIEK